MYEVPDYLKPEDGEHRWSNVMISGLGALEGSNYQLETHGPFLIITHSEPKIVNSSIFIPFFTSQISEGNRLIVTLLCVQEQKEEIHFTFSTTADAEYFNDIFFSRLLSANKTLSSTSPQLCSTQGQFLVLLPGQQTPENAFGNVQVMRDRAEFQVHMIKRIPITCGISYKLTTDTIVTTASNETSLADFSKLSNCFFIRNRDDTESTQILCSTTKEAMLWVICLHAFAKYAGKGVSNDNSEISHTRKKVKKRSKPVKQETDEPKEENKQEEPKEIKNDSIKEPPIEVKEEQKDVQNVETKPIQEEIKPEEKIPENPIEPEKEVKTEMVPEIENKTEEEEDNDEQSVEESYSQNKEEDKPQLIHTFSRQLIPDENRKYKALKNFPLTNKYITLTVPNPNEETNQNNFETQIPISDYTIPFKLLEEPMEVNYDINQKIDPFNFEITKPKEIQVENNINTEQNIPKMSIEQLIKNSIESMPNDIRCPTIAPFEYFDLESLCSVTVSEFPKESQIDVTKYFNFRNSEIMSAKKPKSVFYDTLFSIISEIRISSRNRHHNEDLPINLAIHLAILFSNGFNTFYSFDNFVGELKSTITDKYVLTDLGEVHNSIQFAITTIQNKAILHFLRTMRRNEVIFQKYFYETALIRNTEMVIQLSNQLEPLLFYNSFDYTGLDMRRITFPVYIGFEYLALNYIPRYKGNNDLICKTICEVIHVGVTPAKLWSRLEDLKEFQRESQEMDDLIMNILQTPKSKGTTNFEHLLRKAVEQHKLFLWLALIIDHLNMREMPVDSTLADPYRASLLLKSAYLLQNTN